MTGVLAVGCAGVLLSARASGLRASMPADLQALIGRSQRLSTPDVILAFRDTVVREGKTTVPAAGEIRWRASPREEELDESGLGLAFQYREMNTVVYCTEPSVLVSSIPGLRHRLHGRHWIRFTHEEFARSQGAPLPSFGPRAPNLGAPKGLAALVAVMTNIVENGPTTLDGQPVTQFTGTADPSTLAADFQDGFPEGYTPRSATVVLDLEPDGLLKRVNIAAATDGAHLALTFDVLSIATPVIVQRPSRRDTINWTQLSSAQRTDLSSS